MSRLAIWVILEALAQAPASPVPPLVIPQAADHVDLGPFATLYVERSGALNPEALLSAAGVPGGEPFGGVARALGLLGRVVWLRVDLRSPVDRDWDLLFDSPLAQHLDAYLAQDGQPLAHWRGGFAVAPGERTLRALGPYHAAPVHLLAGASATLLLRAQMPGRLMVVPRLWDPRALAARDAQVALVLGLTYGLLLTVLLVTLYAWFANRDRWSPLFFLQTATFTLYLTAALGFAQAFLWPAWGWWSTVSDVVLAFTAVACGLGSSRRLLESSRFPALDWLTGALFWVMGGCALLSLEWPMLGGVALTALAPLSLLALNGLSLLAVLRGDGPARFFLLGTLLTALFGILASLVSAGLVPLTPLTEDGIYVAASLAAVLQLFCLVARVEIGGQLRRVELEHQVSDRVADLQRSLRRLAESEERLRTIFELSPDAITLIRESTQTFEVVNPAYTRLVGHTAAESIGRTPHELGHYARPEEMERLREALSRGRLHEFPLSIRSKDGQVHDTVLSVTWVEAGGDRFFFTYMRDVTAFRRAEAQRLELEDKLRQAQKMEAIGQLAGGVAHDFNNLLTVIYGNAALARERVTPQAEVGQLLGEISAAAERAAGLTHQLLAFSRRAHLAPRPVELAEQIGALRPILRRLIPANVELQFELAAGQRPVMADPNQLEQIVLNLAVNARDALPHGGELRIATAHVELGESGDPPVTRPPGTYGVIAVSDNGVGIAPEVRDRIFEPFFTTKKETGGTGMGLSTVYGIASQHGGFVDVESALGQGTTFRVYLPEAAASTLAPRPAVPPPLVLGRGTVLLAEDDRQVRASTQQLLRRLGYQVVAAADGEEALELFAQEPSAIDLLLSDVVMPRLNGRELVERVRAIRSDLPVVLVSGYTQDVLAGEQQLPAHCTLLLKPFKLSELSEVLSAALPTPWVAANT